MDLLEMRVGQAALLKAQRIAVNRPLDSLAFKALLERESGKNLNDVFNFWVFAGEPTPENDPRKLFKDADLVFCYAGNLGWDARDALAPLGDKAVVKDDLDELIAAVAAAAKSGDQILVMSNGGFGGIHEKLLKKL